MSKKFKVTLHWDARITNSTYSVRAKTLEDAYNVLAGREEWGKFDWSLNSRDVHEGSEDKKVLSVRFNAFFKIMMPVWKEYRRQAQECREEWDRMWHKLKEHEDGHRERFESAVNKLIADVEAKGSVPKSELDAFVSARLQAIDDEQKKYDRETDNGRSRGVQITLTEKCRAKETK